MKRKRSQGAERRDCTIIECAIYDGKGRKGRRGIGKIVRALSYRSQGD